MQTKYIKAKREAEKEKLKLDDAYGHYGEPDDEYGQRKRPGTRRLKRACLKGKRR